MSTSTEIMGSSRRNENFPGYTRIGAHALSNAARGIAGSLFGVEPYLVRVFLRDDAGYLSLSIHLPLSICSAATPMLHNVRTQRPILGRQFTELTGAQVSKIDIRITGVAATASWTEA